MSERQYGAPIDTQNKCRILVIDDDTDNINLIREALSRAGYLTNDASNGEDGLHKIKAWNPHLILLDMNMPGLDGIKTLELIRKNHVDEYIAVLFITGNSQVDDIVKGLDAGADDYIVKPFRISELLARIRAKLRVKEINDQLRRSTKRLEELVDRDQLTGLYNMHYVYRRLEQELTRAKRYQKCISCIMIDLDNFKNVNDENDHLFGSWILTDVARIIKECARSIDIAARYGGDEYLLILPETDLAGAERFAERLRKSIEQTHFLHEGQKTQITCSLGVVAVDMKTNTIDGKSFVRIADQMLYDAKNSGRNCFKSKLIKDTTS
jgi:two-component system cell cycle response regulator